MPLYENTRVEFGHPGPFKAISKQALADEFQLMFDYWAHEIFRNLPDFVQGKIEYIHNYRKYLRELFISGLVEDNGDNDD